MHYEGVRLVSGGRTFWIRDQQCEEMEPGKTVICYSPGRGLIVTRGGWVTIRS